MSNSSGKSYTSLTEFEVQGLHIRYTFADGHAYHEMPSALQPVIADLPAIWQYSKTKSVPDIEEEFKRSKASLIGSPSLAAHPHYSISPIRSRRASYPRHRQPQSRLSQPKAARHSAAAPAIHSRGCNNQKSPAL